MRFKSLCINRASAHLHGGSSGLRARTSGVTENIWAPLQSHVLGPLVEFYKGLIPLSLDLVTPSQTWSPMLPNPSDPELQDLFDHSIIWHSNFFVMTAIKNSEILFAHKAPLPIHLTSCMAIKSMLYCSNCCSSSCRALALKSDKTFQLPILISIFRLP
ncbi:hypothetical protein TNCV_3827861 [Trichonephila clavipes]|nr:hypothetical protein TNCV_3827861 [Trichonephila clavipes]